MDSGFQVQRLIPEDLGWGLVAEAFARRVVVGLDELGEAGGRQRGEVGFAGQGAAQASPMAFSMPPFCQGAWGSQKKVWMPWAWRW